MQNDWIVVCACARPRVCVCVFLALNGLKPAIIWNFQFFPVRIYLTDCSYSICYTWFRFWSLFISFVFNFICSVYTENKCKISLLKFGRFHFHIHANWYALNWYLTKKNVKKTTKCTFEFCVKINHMHAMPKTVRKNNYMLLKTSRKI